MGAQAFEAALHQSRSGLFAEARPLSFARGFVLPEGLSAHRVQVQITAELKSGFARVEDNRFEAPLQKTTGPLAPTAIEPDGITDIEPLHGLAEVGRRRFQQQMVMVAHEHVSVEYHSKAVDHFIEQFAEMLAIPVITKNGSPFHATGGDVIPRAGARNSEWTCHGENPMDAALAVKHFENK